MAARIERISKDRLPAGDVLVRVQYSSLNYKDGLAVTGKPGVIRSFPMVAGIDFAGAVEESTSAEFRPGDLVAVTGAGAGETAWGGYAQYARWNAESLIVLPPGISPKRAMAIGTAGFTAMQSVIALERLGLMQQGSTAPGEVLVTGAAGGVGSVAVAILSKLGYRVAASTDGPSWEIICAPWARAKFFRGNP